MRQSRYRACGLALTLGLTAPMVGAAQTASADPPDPGGATFLLVPVGARAAALGQAAMADGGTSESVFWNPAGLAWMERGEVGVHHARTFVSDNTAVSAAFVSHAAGVFALTAYLVDFGSQEVVNFPAPGGPVTGRISPKNIELLASYGLRVIGGLAVGVNYKLIQFRQDCSGDCGFFPTTVGTTHGIDVGVQYGFGAGRPLVIGAAVQHVGFRLQLENREQADPLPTRMQIGVAYRLRLPNPAPDTEPLDARFLVDLVNEWGQVASPDVSVGVELGYGDLIRLRTGYASINQLFVENDAETGARGPSVGIGVRLGRVSVDFSRIFFDNANFDEPVYIGIRADF